MGSGSTERRDDAAGKEDGRSALVVEDNAPLRVELGELLKREGWFVTLCPDGPSAIQRAVACHYDVALIDYTIPGIRGAVVAETIRVLNPRTCIIGISLQDRSAEFLAAGADGFLLKPFEVRDVDRILETAGRPDA